MKRKKYKANAESTFFKLAVFLILVLLPITLIELFYDLNSFNRGKQIMHPAFGQGPCSPKDCLEISKKDNAKLFLLPDILPTPTPTVIPPTPTSTPVPTQPVGYCVNVPVLLYHHVQPQALAIEKKQTSLSVDNGIFDAQMAYLVSHGYTSISAEQLVNALITKSPLSLHSIVITLDDGYKDAYTYAYPIFQKYNITVNLLIPPGLLEGADYMSWSQLGQMAGNNLVHIVNHTWSHFSLPGGDGTKIRFEVETAEKELEQHLGKKLTVFGYPYGSFNSLAIQILQQEGFVGAFTTIPGTLECDSFIMALHRTRIGNSPLSFYGL